MFTKNYQIYRERLFSGGRDTCTIIDTSGTSHTVYYGDGLLYLDIGYYLGRTPTLHSTKGSISSSSKYSTKNCGVVFGSGNAPATREDIDLENRITEGLDVTSGGTNLGKVEDKHYCAWSSFTLTNTSEEDIVIREIGILTNFAASSSENYAILMERTVLDEPIIIAPNDQKIITYKIDFYH